MLNILGISALLSMLRQDEHSLLLRGRDQLQGMIQKLQGADADEIMSSTSDESSSSDSFSQCVTDLHNYVQLLGELHASIEPLLPILEDQPDKIAQDGTQDGASMFYADIIRQKFTDAPTTLIDILGKLNLERFTRMATMREHNLAAPEVVQDVSKGPSSTYFHDSGLGSSLPSHLVPSKSAPSLAFTLAGASRTKLPPLPIGASRRPFECDYCGKTVTILTKREWEYVFIWLNSLLLTAYV